jgi:hypothetical protein
MVPISIILSKISKKLQILIYAYFIAPETAGSYLLKDIAIITPQGKNKGNLRKDRLLSCNEEIELNSTSLK